MTLVAPRIVNDVSYVMRINHEILTRIILVPRFDRICLVRILLYIYNYHILKILKKKTKNLRKSYFFCWICFVSLTKLNT